MKLINQHSDCFKSGPQGKMVFNSKTIHYYELLNDLRLCIEDNKNVTTHETAYTKQICQNCKVTFEKVNHFYDEIHKKFDKQVCYDLVDSVINFICCVINRIFFFHQK